MCECFKEKRTKTLKMNKITVGLTLNECTEFMGKVCPYGTYLLLGSLKHVLRGRKVTKNCS